MINLGKTSLGWKRVILKISAIRVTFAGEAGAVKLQTPRGKPRGIQIRLYSSEYFWRGKPRGIKPEEIKSSPLCHARSRSALAEKEGLGKIWKASSKQRFKIPLKPPLQRGDLIKFYETKTLTSLATDYSPVHTAVHNLSRRLRLSSVREPLFACTLETTSARLKPARPILCNLKLSALSLTCDPASTTPLIKLRCCLTANHLRIQARIYSCLNPLITTCNAPSTQCALRLSLHNIARMSSHAYRAYPAHHSPYPNK